MDSIIRISRTDYIPFNYYNALVNLALGVHKINHEQETALRFVNLLDIYGSITPAGWLLLNSRWELPEDHPQYRDIAKELNVRIEDSERDRVMKNQKRVLTEMGFTFIAQPAALSGQFVVKHPNGEYVRQADGTSFFRSEYDGIAAAWSIVEPIMHYFQPASK